MRVFFGSLLFAFLLLFGGCQNKNTQDEIRIAANPWIGFTPFMYAQEKGWLNNSKFKFIWNVGLGENVALYEKGLSEGFTATQYDYLSFKDRGNLKPYFIIDYSKGADIVLSNKTIEELKKAEKIDCLFELSSVNKDLFNAFAKENELNESKCDFKNRDQGSISELKAGSTPSILISYEPYASAIERHGFKKISSTKELKSIAVIDAIFIDEKALSGNEKELKNLHEIFKKAMLALKNDKKEFYETVKGYLENQSYQEFEAALSGIEWPNDENSKKAKEHLQKQSIPTDKLMI